MLESLDPNVTLTGLLVAVPATIGAWAALKNGRAMKTNHGLRPGEHIELIHAKVELLEEGQRDANALMISHLASDVREFGAIRRQLDAQDTKTAQVKHDLEDQS